MKVVTIINNLIDAKIELALAEKESYSDNDDRRANIRGFITNANNRLEEELTKLEGLK